MQSSPLTPMLVCPLLERSSGYFFNTGAARNRIATKCAFTAFVFSKEEYVGLSCTSDCDKFCRHRRHHLISSLHDCKSTFSHHPVDTLESQEIFGKHHALNFKKRVQLDGITNAERAFVFKLFLCNPFARSAGIFLSFIH